MARQRASQARDAFARVGTVTVPPPGPEAAETTPPAPEAQPASPAPVRRDVTASRSNQREPAGAERRRRGPAVSTAIALTLRFDPEEFADTEDLISALRRQLRYSRLDKSEVGRALFRLARRDPLVRQALLDELREPGS